jgi:uncharacterized protein YbjT (DUF2867 family)
MLRHFPVFGVFGDGSYRFRPIYLDDLARLALEHGTRRGNVAMDAIGPEAFTYRQLVRENGRLLVQWCYGMAAQRGDRHAR